MTDSCDIPPEGWQCSREKGHEGPCAATATRRKLIRPESNCPSFVVYKENLHRVLDEAKEMMRLIDTKDFEGHYKDAMALAHCQVFRTPLSFFVVNKEAAKTLGGRVIVNPHVKGLFGQNVKMLEACMSFPYHKPAKLERCKGAVVEYELPFLGRFLRKKRIAVEGVLAEMFQHECEHFVGMSPYHRESITTK